MAVRIRSGEEISSDELQTAVLTNRKAAMPIY